MRSYQKIILVMSLIIAPLAGTQAADLELSPCKASPDCASLGYTEDASKCIGEFLRCPWDLNKASCTTCQIAHCAKCKESNPSECETCESGYYGKPVAFSGQETHYTSCEEFAGGGSIVCSIANCNTCENSFKCKECRSGYALSVDGTKCTSFTIGGCNVANCETCSPFDNNKCMTCMLRYSLTSDGKCVILPNS